MIDMVIGLGEKLGKNKNMKRVLLIIIISMISVSCQKNNQTKLSDKQLKAMEKDLLHWIENENFLDDSETNCSQFDSYSLCIDMGCSWESFGDGDGSGACID